MNIKKALLVTLSTGLIATTLVNTNYVSASTDEDSEENQDPISEVKTPKSDVEITFTDNKEPAKLLNPENPSEVLEGEDYDKASESGTITNQAGPLSLDYVSHIKFPEQEVNLEGGNYYSTTDTPYIQVTDKRGPKDGWNITAKAQQFENVETKTSSLPGAELKFINGAADNGKLVDANIDEIPDVIRDINIPTNDTAVNIASSSVENSDEGVTKGLGSWIIKWEHEEVSAGPDNGVSLEVPPNSATAGDHKTVIEWTLDNGPFNDKQ